MILETRRVWSMTAVVVLLLLFAAEDVVGQVRMFATCSTVDSGFETSVSRGETRRLSAVCSQELARSTTQNTSVAISASSLGAVPFRVTGGQDDLFISPGEIFTRPSDERPEGPWFLIGAVNISTRPGPAFDEISTDLGFFKIGLKDLGVETFSREQDLVTLTLNNGDMVIMEVTTNERERYIVYTFRSLSPQVFAGFKFEESKMYVQVVSEGFFFRRTSIEVGWSPPSNLDVGGNFEEGMKVLEVFILEILANLEDEFGHTCRFALNVRTIEGDCNNLDDPPLGSAREALRRLGGTDPAFPKGKVEIPAGPLDINVREVSNALFAMSPGAFILDAQAESLRRSCFSTQLPHGTFVKVCPFEAVKFFPKKSKRAIVVPFKKVFFNECEDLSFRFSSKTCTIDILLRCSGESRLELADDPCGAETNRLFDPVGCVIKVAEDSVLENSDGLTDLFFTFAQFVDHDYGLSPLSQINADQPGFNTLSRPAFEPEFPIEVPDDDFHFNRSELEFTRARFSEDVPNSQINLHSSYLDGSQIYGVDFKRSRLIRSFEGGRLALSDGDLPPFNRIEGPGALGTVVENGPNAGPEFFVVGDSRGNEQVLLLVMHILFLREHNLVADEVAKAFPFYDDEVVYQTARAIVIAEYQCIVYNEFLPLLLGLTAPDPRDFEYDEDLDATVSAIFTTAAYRFGHSLVGTNLLRMGPGPRKKAQMDLIPLREAFFKPEAVSDFGIDPFVRGGAWHLCKELDNKIVDELRNFLVIDFPENETTSLPFDLVSLNLQRGRDMGLPSFNDVRELFGLRRLTTFSEFVSDPNLADLAEQVYGDVNVVDLFFGGMVEDHIAKSQLGETFNTIVAEQFTRSRDGDRFFYTGLEFDPELIRTIPRVQDIIDHKVRLADIIVRTTGIKQEELGTRPSVFQLY